MKGLGEYIKWYMYITTSILIVCAVLFHISGEETIPVETLWQILLSGFLTTLVTVLPIFRECSRKSTAIIKHILHYVLLCAVMFLCGKWFGWMDFELEGIAMMAGAVAVVYLLSFGAYYMIELKQASDINRKLKEKYSGGPEEDVLYNTYCSLANKMKSCSPIVVRLDIWFGIC